MSLIKGLLIAALKYLATSASIIALYYIGFFKFLKDIDALNKINRLSAEKKQSKIQINQAKTKKTATENVRTNQMPSEQKENLFSRMISSLSDDQVYSNSEKLSQQKDISIKKYKAKPTKPKQKRSSFFY